MNGMWKDFVIPLATIILTPGLSFWVIRYELRRGHDFWVKQFEYEKKHEEFKLKVDLLQSASNLVGRFNDLIVHHHIYASSRDTALALRGALSTDQPEVAKYYGDEYESHRSKAADSYLKYRAASIELSSLGAVLGVYFGQEVTKLAHAVRDKGSIAVKPPRSPGEIAEELQATVAAGLSIEEAKDAIAQDYDSRCQAHRPIAETEALLQAVYTAVYGARAN